MSMPEHARQALEAFAQGKGWEQRARLLMQWGDRLEPLADADKTEANRVHGCESLVWLVAEQVDGLWRFTASSDARLLRGLLALLLVRVQGLTSEELARLDLREWFTQLGLERQLSPSRSNGLHAVLQRMAELASNHCPAVLGDGQSIDGSSRRSSSISFLGPHLSCASFIATIRANNSSLVLLGLLLGRREASVRASAPPAEYRDIHLSTVGRLTLYRRASWLLV